MIGLAVTPGDPQGIGPELVIKILKNRAYDHSQSRLVVVGAAAPFESYAKTVHVHKVDLQSLSPDSFKKILRASLPQDLILIEAPLKPKTTRKKNFSLPGFQSGWSIQVATQLVQKNYCAALVTGPISKERFNLGGFHFPGHTEFLAHLTKTKRVTMMLANEQLRVALVTIHLPLNQVSKNVTPARIKQTILHTEHVLIHGWGIKNPRIAVCALNPHAGEAGLLGKEEIKVITPTLKKLILKRELYPSTTLTGPLPADTLFTKIREFDAVICMYHDQGLIPVKQIDFARTVNITLGLPIIRTSVDHGVAFELVGTNKADPTSLQSAIQLALQLVHTKEEQNYGSN